MAQVPVWQANKYYPNGFVVQPSTVTAPAATDIENPNFDGNADGWTLGGTAVFSAAGGFSGPGCVSMSGGSGGVEMASPVAVSPGQQVTASCRIKTTGGSAGNLGDINLNWYDSGMVLLSRSEGAEVTQAGGTSWRQTSVTGTAPAGAAFLAVQGDASPAGGGSVLFDAFSWNYTAPEAAESLIYVAVQPETGLSAGIEPVWPTELGQSVVDGGVIWEAMLASRITWQASPLFVSGPDEPDWPLDAGGSVVNGTLTLTAVPQRVTDENCPNTSVVTMGASKIFAGDGDITRFCATNNPTDWTTPEDAGYLATGFQEYGANDVGVLNIYRGSLAAMNSEVFQLWQIDPDPLLMSIVDQMPGVGSTYQKSAKSVSNDLLYLTSAGIRSVGIAGGSTNLQAGDVGMPIDPLVQAALIQAEADGVKPIGLYFPAAGQYWLAFPSPSGEALTPISDTEIAYNFFGDDLVTMVGSTVSYSGASTADFGITFPDGSYQIRVIPRVFTVGGGEGDGSFAVFNWDTGNAGTASQSNESIPSGAAFDPNPIDMAIVVDNDATYNGFTFSFGSESDTEYEFDIYVVGEQVPGSTQVFVGDMSGGGKIKWSRYILPFSMEDFTILGDKLLLRGPNFIVEVDDQYLVDDVASPVGSEMVWSTVEFTGTLRWPYLDFGSAGADKQMLGLDIAADGTSSFSVGYDQKNFAAMTDPLVIPADSFYEGMIPYEVVAPTFSVQLEFAANQKWRLDALILFMEQ